MAGSVSDFLPLEESMVPQVQQVHVDAVIDDEDLDMFCDRGDTHRCCCCDVCCYPDCPYDFDDYIVVPDFERQGRLEMSEYVVEASEEAEQRKQRHQRESARRAARRERQRS